MKERKKIRYGWHPAEYAIGENEKYYGEMAAKGWRLTKRGQHLSRFEKDSPQKSRYRIEMSAPAFLDEDQTLPEEQVALYEECGWKLVTSYRLMHVFVANEGSDAPEFYQQPEQQAATLKALRREYIWGLVPLVFYLILDVLVVLAIWGRSVTWEPVIDLRMGIVQMTGLFLLILFLVHWSLYRLLYGAYRTLRMYRELKRGIPLDHAPKGRHRVRNGVYILFGVFSIAAGAATLVQVVSSYGEELSADAQAPYLLLQDMGLFDLGESVYPSNREHPVEYTESLLAKQWYVYEASGEEWMYQDIYEMPNEDMAVWMAETLLENSVFAEGQEEYQRVEIEGLRCAWQTDLEFVAVQGESSVLYHVFDVAAQWRYVAVRGVSEKGESGGMNQILETKRLVLREMEETDYEALCRMLQDPEVMYAYEHAFSDEEAWGWLHNQIRRYREEGFGLWAVILKESGEMIGQCGLTLQPYGEERVVEVGYLFQKAYWHQGYAIEAAMACRDYAFKTLKIPSVYSIIRDNNLASQRVAERNGMRRVDQIVKHYYNMDMPHWIYRVDASEEIVVSGLD